MSHSFEAGTFAKPRGPARVAKTHLALLAFYGFMALLVLAVGAFAMDHISWVLALMLAIPMPVHFALYRGASAEKNWARYGSIAVGVLMLFLFPIGTVIGAFMIINAASNWKI